MVNFFGFARDLRFLHPTARRTFARPNARPNAILERTGLRKKALRLLQPLYGLGLSTIND